MNISGEHNTTLLVEIRPDNIPELNETFIVELYNVSGQNQRLQDGVVSEVIFGIISEKKVVYHSFTR